MSRDLILGGLAGAASALLVMAAASSSFGLLLGYLAPLPLFFAGLTRGVMPALVAAIAGALVSGFYGLIAAVMFLLLFGLPAFWLVRQALLARPAAEAGPDAEAVSGSGSDDGFGALEWYPAGSLVVWLAAWAAGLVILAWLLTAGQEGGLGGALQPLLLQVFSALPAQTGAGGDNTAAADLAGRLARVMPAVMAVSWMLMLTVNGVLAQGLAGMLKQNRRPSPRYGALTLPRFLAIALPLLIVAAVLMAGNTATVAMALAAIAAFPLFLRGLAVVHVMAAAAPATGLILAAFYAALVVAGALVGMLVVILGLIEEWAGIRRRLAASGTSRESE